MTIDEITASEVRKAINECDEKGHDAFLAEYGFREANMYKLLSEGREYASKAILGVAHRFLPGRVALTAYDFGGGKTDAALRLRKLGFDVTGPGRNPPWVKDELILALELYLTNPASPPSQTSRPVRVLSDLLNKMHQLNGAAKGTTLRNTNGVYLKMMNLRALDPNFTTVGKVGMQAGGALDKVVWAQYAGRPKELAADAKQIREAISNSDAREVATLPLGEQYEGEEGGIIIRLHKRYERDPKLIAKKKKAAKAAGSMACEVCNFDFGSRYGSHGEGFIEVHHVRPLHTMMAGAKTRLEDLALLCSNCHRMAHRQRTPLSIDELRTLIQ